MLAKIEELSIPEPNTGCWLWLGCGSGRSARYGEYGRLWVNGRNCGAHRVSFEAAVGPIPNGMRVLHHCDTPACVNPAHLFLGTMKDNAADRDRKQRRRAPQGESNGAAKITAEIALAVRLAGGTQQSIADRYGIHQTTVSLIKLGRLWKCLDSGHVVVNPRGG